MNIHTKTSRLALAAICSLLLSPLFTNSANGIGSTKRLRSKIIWISPGECAMAAQRRVCATEVGPKDAKVMRIYAYCSLGKLKRNVNEWGLYQATTLDDGEIATRLIRAFPYFAKGPCEVEAERYNSKGSGAD